MAKGEYRRVETFLYYEILKTIEIWRCDMCRRLYWKCRCNK